MLTFHHIGIACQDVQETMDWFRKTHHVIRDKGPVFDPLQKATLAIIYLEEGPMLELIAGEPVKNILAKGCSLYHLCYAAKDIEKEVENLCAQGALMFSPPTEAVLFDKKRVAFLKTPIGIIEIVEE